jgi:hypothetical protein
MKQEPHQEPAVIIRPRTAVLAVLLAACIETPDDEPDASLPDAASDATEPDATEPDATEPDATVDASVDATEPDATVDAAVDASVDATVDASVDAAPDARDAGPIVATVARADGGREVRQGTQATLVITGADLAAATAVTVGPFSAPITSATDSELRVTLAVPHGFAPASLAVTVTTPDGATTLAAAIDTTYVVIAAGAGAGRGTHESPLGLCDDGVATAAAGDRLALLAGEHVCARRLELPGGLEIVGAGADVTYLASGFGGFFVWDSADQQSTTVAALTARGGAALVTAEEAGGVVLRDVTIEGGSGAAVVVFEIDEYPQDRPVTIDGLRYRGTGTALVLDYATARVTGSALGGARGIFIREGSLEVRASTITSTGTGIAGGRPPEFFFDLPVDVRVIASQIAGSTTGIDIENGEVSVEAAEISAGTAIRLRNGIAEVSGGSRLIATSTAIDATNACDWQWDGNVYVDIDGATLEAGGTGLRHWSCSSGRATIRRATIRGDAVAAVSLGDAASRYDLGTEDDAGDNALATTDGFALLDTRSFTLAPNASILGGPDVEVIDAVGTTLNGRSYAGQRIEGRAELRPDYRISSFGVVQF